jgi:malate synthase
MLQRDIPYYEDYVGNNFINYLKEDLSPYPGVKGLEHIGQTGGLEAKDSLQFVCDLYEKIKGSLNQVLNQRQLDRKFIDERTKAYYQYNKENNIDLLSKEYKTIIGDTDEAGRIVIGPKLKNYCGKSDGKPVAPIPEYLDGFHVTLFGPPDDAKLSINAMNAYHRKLKEEPPIVDEILKSNKEFPKWGADDEDSKTPLRSDLITAGENLSGCFNADLEFHDDKRGKNYTLSTEKLSQPIKRFPGLALPSTFLFYQGNPLPLHIYDFALHLFHHWHNPKALCFYVPKLENEEEAAYIKYMFETAEKMIKDLHPEYQIGTIRCIIVLENPRAVFRVNEIMDELYPYFVGASLGWHDYLGSTARLLKEDGNYRIPVKADPDIVIKYIKASHELLANVVGERGGIKIGGMYGILPINNDLFSESFQITIRGFFRDVLTQLKRNLSGYWVAHPDFIRIGIAIVEAWRIYQNGDDSKLKGIIDGLLNKEYANEIWKFVHASDIESLDVNNELYARALIVADIKESSFIPNNHPDEVRYNVFQMLQYLTDWLSGNGCVALPTQINGIPARIMDDLATAERSRWEVWHEITHGRFSVEEFIQIAHEEMNFIRRDLSDDKKIVQIKYTPENAKWYEVSMKLMIQLMTSNNPPEFATELLLPFTLDKIRESEKPWNLLNKIDPKKYYIDDYILRYNYYFEMCGAHKFAREQVKNIVVGECSIEKSILSFNKDDILSAASFHGDIGQSLQSLDAMAQTEQAKVAKSDSQTINDLVDKTNKYLKKFGFKFLISAKDKNAFEILEELNKRINHSEVQEIENAKKALLEITLKRVATHPLNGLKKKLSDIFKDSKVTGMQLAISSGKDLIQTISMGTKDGQNPVENDTDFQIASLSKTYISVLFMELLKSKNIALDTKVNDLLKEYKGHFLLEGKYADDVEVQHLMSHSALNMHYVNGVPSSHEMPNISDFLSGNEKYGYEKIKVINKPGCKFQYSGAGFVLIEYLIELIANKNINDLSPYCFLQKRSDQNYAIGFNQDGTKLAEGYKMFPAGAAGRWDNAKNVNKFLQEIAYAYDHLEGTNSISHDTAVLMTYSTDKGCKSFMNAKMGLGVFTVEAGKNEFLLHQGANDGFRSIFLYCYKGPDKYKGITVLSNGELNSVFLNARIIQEVLKELKLSGVDINAFESDFEFNNLKQEEIVNIGYKNLILKAFKETLPEKIQGRETLCPLSSYNILKDAHIINVTNQRFARAENLISPFEPIFDPALFGDQGKVMDSWETERHNISGYDELELRLTKPANINYIFISTKYHDGNQVEYIELYANNKIFLNKIKLAGHSYQKIKLDHTIENVSEITVRVYPDGGLTRLGLYAELPDELAEHFVLLKDSKNIRYDDNIPLVESPMTLSFDDSNADMYIISASDEHYAPAKNILSPFQPLNMFDGLESKRSRAKGHKEEVIIGLKEKKKIKEIYFDFKYFINNNPQYISIYVEIDGEFKQVISNYWCKPYKGNELLINLGQEYRTQKVKINFLPDGGVNRIRLL